MTPLSSSIQFIAVRKCCKLYIYFSTCIPLQNDQPIIYQLREGKPALQEDPHIQNCKTISKRTKQHHKEEKY